MLALLVLERVFLLQHGRHALHLAASAGHADVVAALLLAGADVNVTDAVSRSLHVHSMSLCVDKLTRFPL